MSSMKLIEFDSNWLQLYHNYKLIRISFFNCLTYTPLPRIFLLLLLHHILFIQKCPSVFNFNRNVNLISGWIHVIHRFILAHLNARIELFWTKASSYILYNVLDYTYTTMRNGDWSAKPNWIRQFVNEKYDM